MNATDQSGSKTLGRSQEPMAPTLTQFLLTLKRQCWHKDTQLYWKDWLYFRVVGSGRTGENHPTRLWQKEKQNLISMSFPLLTHCWYIEPRNREKSLRLIWQRFSCLLDEWIAKISKKKFFSRWLFDIIHIFRFEIWDLEIWKYFWYMILTI